MTRRPASARRRTGHIPSPQGRAKHPDSPIPRSILAGQDEGIFRCLPQTVIDNLRRPASENALVWNLLYPLARPMLSLQSLLGLRPLWGSVQADQQDEDLIPYFWGYGIAGDRLDGLDDALDKVDGPGLQTEVDVVLVGDRSLVLVEATHLAAPGRCGRYLRRVCPEVHPGAGRGAGACRYWEAGESSFSDLLDFGARPTADSPQPPCAAHYQLGRTLLLARALARRLERRPHLWVIAPRSRWLRLERGWLDFADRLRDPADWRASRVLAWEDVRRL